MRKISTKSKSVSTKPVATRKRSAPQTECVIGSKKLELLVGSVVETFSTDPTFPSITLSYKTNSDEYYASVTRYGDTYGRAPKSLINACGDSLGEALDKLFNMWLNRIAPAKNATNALRASRERGEL